MKIIDLFEADKPIPKYQERDKEKFWKIFLASAPGFEHTTNGFRGLENLLEYHLQAKHNINGTDPVKIINAFKKDFDKADHKVAFDFMRSIEVSEPFKKAKKVYNKQNPGSKY